MKRIRAIYMGDMKFEICRVFELKENGYFEMLEDIEFRYEKEIVEDDNDWLIFEVDIEKEFVKLNREDNIVNAKLIKMMGLR